MLTAHLVASGEEKHIADAASLSFDTLCWPYTVLTHGNSSVPLWTEVAA